MLRPAVAAANSARPGKASGLDIARRSPSVKKPGYGVLRGRSDKVPGRRQPVNDSPKTALSPGTGKLGPPQIGFIGRDEPYSLTKRCFPPVYQRLPPHIMMGARAGTESQKTLTS